MSKALWFVIGCIAGEFAGRWFTHAFYIMVIGTLLLAKRFCA